jgi:hypothetical protein
MEVKQSFKSENNQSNASIEEREIRTATVLETATCSFRVYIMNPCFDCVRMNASVL